MGKERNGVNINCIACRKEFYVPNYRKDSAKFCSHECQNHRQYDKHVFNCKSCGKKVVTSPSRKIASKKFCSLECREANAMGIKERRKQIKALSKLKRGSSGSRDLRKYVFLFVPKICEICRYDEYDFCLDLHHIDEDPTNNELDNISVLCCMCHRKLHKGLIILGERRNEDEEKRH
jgi:hypothetical protein